MLLPAICPVHPEDWGTSLPACCLVEGRCCHALPMSHSSRGGIIPSAVLCTHRSSTCGPCKCWQPSVRCVLRAWRRLVRAQAPAWIPGSQADRSHRGGTARGYHRQRGGDIEGKELCGRGYAPVISGLPLEGYAMLPLLAGELFGRGREGSTPQGRQQGLSPVSSGSAARSAGPIHCEVGATGWIE